MVWGLPDSRTVIEGLEAMSVGGLRIPSFLAAVRDSAVMIVMGLSQEGTPQEACLTAPASEATTPRGFGSPASEQMGRQDRLWTGDLQKPAPGRADLNLALPGDFEE
jgi:hypothetical protein